MFEINKNAYWYMINDAKEVCYVKNVSAFNKI